MMTNLYAAVYDVTTILAKVGLNHTANNVGDNFLKLAVTIGGTILGIYLIFAIVKDGIEYAKGGGNVSIWKIIGKVVFLIFCIGLIFLAQGWMHLGQKAQEISSKSLDIIQNGAEEIVN